MIGKSADFPFFRSMCNKHKPTHASSKAKSAKVTIRNRVFWVVSLVSILTVLVYFTIPHVIAIIAFTNLLWSWMK